MASLLDKTTFRIRIIRESALILVVIFATYLINIQLRVQIEQTDAAIVSENNLYGLREYHQETFDLLEQRLVAMKAITERIDKALPATEDIGDFLTILSTYGAKNGVVVNVSVGTAAISTIQKDGVALQTIAIAIDVNGEANALRQYINAIEHLPYFFAISGIDERRDPAKPGFRHLVIAGTLWTKPTQTLTQMQQ